MNQTEIIESIRVLLDVKEPVIDYAIHLGQFFIFDLEQEVFQDRQYRVGTDGAGGDLQLLKKLGRRDAEFHYVFV